MSFVIDCIRSPSTDAMRAAGVTGVSRYLSWQDRDSLGKVIHPAEYDRLRADGFGVLLNWEYSATDWLGGAPAGTAHGIEAVRQARALGHPTGTAIPGSADFDMSLAQWNGMARFYAKAYSDALRSSGYRPGVYGPWDVLTWCRDAGYMEVFWQAGMSTAWSGGRNRDLWPGAHLRQRRQIFIGGVDCDLNDIIQPDYGQAGVSDMEQNEKVQGWSNLVREVQVGWTLADLQNLRDELTLPTDKHSPNPPAPNSRFDLLVRAAQKILAAPDVQPLILTDVQLQTVVDGVASKVVDAHAALTAADQPVIAAAVLQALRLGTDAQ